MGSSPVEEIDVTSLRLEGVVAVLHHRNAPDIPWYADSKLFDEHLRYQGDEVAMVAAETAAIAEEANSTPRIAPIHALPMSLPRSSRRYLQALSPHRAIEPALHSPVRCQRAIAPVVPCPRVLW